MPTSSGRGLHGSLSLPRLGTIRLFTFCLSCECIIVSCFNLRFPDDGWGWVSFPTLTHYLYFSVYGISVHIVFAQFSIICHFFLDSWLYILDAIQYVVSFTCCNYLLLVCGLSFNSCYGVFRWTKILNFNLASCINLCLYGLYLLCLAGEILPGSEVVKIFSYFIFQ